LSKFEPLHGHLIESNVIRTNVYEGVFPTFIGTDICVEPEEAIQIQETSELVAQTNTPSVKIQTHQQLIDEAYNHGYEAGIVEARKNCELEYRQHLLNERKECERFVESLSKQFSRLAASLEVNAVRLAVAIADKIMKKEVTIDGTVVLHQIRESLHRVWGVDMVKLRINPMDEELVREQRSALLAGSDFIREVMIEADENVERGGCVIESSAGNVDARISTQLKQIETVFLSQAPVLERGSI
jgi:flagellar assembly protein FliH